MGDWWWARWYARFSYVCHVSCHSARLENASRPSVYDLAHHQSPIAQWLERPTSILEGDWFNSRWGSENSFFWVFRLESISPLFNQIIFIVQFVISKHQRTTLQIELAIFQSFKNLLVRISSKSFDDLYKLRLVFTRFLRHEEITEFESLPDFPNMTSHFCAYVTSYITPFTVSLHICSNFFLQN